MSDKKQGIKRGGTTNGLNIINDQMLSTHGPCFRAENSWNCDLSQHNTWNWYKHSYDFGITPI